jgi:vitamin B12/bleomycin/antimicrobial peptide transport system ATP-binding/permease protein
VKNFVNSEVGWRAKGLFALLVALLCVASGFNVANSYVGRNFMTAIADRDQSQFVRWAAFYIGVFGASTLVSIVARFAEERLSLLWRQDLTQRSVTLYLSNAAYYQFSVSGELANPDQRIAEDIRAFTVTTLSFVLMALNSVFAILAFSGVLWSISPLLFVVSIAYAACGSFLTIVLGRPLVKLNYDQLDKEASFRSGLIHVHENAEQIMLARREGRHADRLLRRLDDLVANYRRITAVNRNVGFFTTGYNWLIQIIPALIIAPSFIDGRIEFGVISQSSMAFTAVVAAFSLIVTQFQSLSAFAAVVARLSSLVEAVEKARSPAEPQIDMVEADDRVAFEQLTLLSGADRAPLVKDLSVSIPVGTRVLLTGSSHAARAALFKAVAVSTTGSGRIVRPGPDRMLFLPQRPYLPPGTLREVLLIHANDADVSDDRTHALMHELRLDQVLTRAGGLDAEQDWTTFISLREQKLLGVAEIILAQPAFVFLDGASATLGAEEANKVLRMLTERSIAYINNDEANETGDLYDAILVCDEDGAWAWTKET